MSCRLMHIAVPAALVVLAIGCASDSAGGTATGDDRHFVPETLPNTNLNGNDDGLTLVAFTLVRESTGPALYAAVANRAATPACQAGMTTDFYDQAGQRVTSAGAVLRGRRPYRMPDGTVIPCVGPGELAMAGVTGLDDFAIDGLGRLEHRFPAFVIDGMTPVDGLSVRELRAGAVSGGYAYAGVLENGFDFAVTEARVTVFPVNRVGRPLGMGSSLSADVAAGASRSFATGPVTDTGTDAVAFPSATFPN
jgi:hypothetical protein